MGAPEAFGAPRVLRQLRPGGAPPGADPAPQGLALGRSLERGAAAAVSGRGQPPPAPAGPSVTAALSPGVPRVLARPQPVVSAGLEELYENQSRDPGGDWSPSGTASTDAVSGDSVGDSGGDTRMTGLSSRLALQSGVAVPSKEEVACPQGWRVTSDWHVDTEGDVDEDGEWGSMVGTAGREVTRRGGTGMEVAGWR